MAVARLLAEPIDWRYKAFPATPEPVTVGTVGRMRWNLLAGDLPLPAMVLKQSALEHNIELVARYCHERGVLIAPHGKTTMAPQLFRRQLQAGAWGMTAATIGHVRIYRAFGVDRILLANQLVERTALRWLTEELRADGAFDFYCLVDSVDGVTAMSEGLAELRLERPVQVLVEVGFTGGRTGCRTDDEALAVAAAVAASPVLELAGVEGYEGLLGHSRSQRTLDAVDRFLDRLRRTAIALARTGTVFLGDRVIVSAGGSGFFDRVVEKLTEPWPLDQQVDVVLRCGSYVTHDSVLYERLSPFAAAAGGSDTLRPAIEVWGAVLSRPEPRLAIVGFGKRDVSYDLELPVPVLVHGRSGLRALSEGALRVTALNDQHAIVRLEVETDLAVGDLLGCGVSHPCTAFDKWRLIPVVDDEYTVVDAIATLF